MRHNQEIITATKIVGSADRLKFFPKHVGTRLLMVAEASICAAMRSICVEYEGGMWDFFELSNGGFFICPQIKPQHPSGELHIMVTSNFADLWLTPEAAGIVATLFGLGSLYHARGHLRDNESVRLISEKRESLIAYVSQHGERERIYAAID
jgi:hypothetical protein